MFAVGGLILLAPAASAVDFITLQAPGLSGTFVTIPAASPAVQLLSVSTGLSGTYAGYSGPLQQVQASALTMTKYVEANSPALLLHALTGTTYPSATITLWTATPGTNGSTTYQSSLNIHLTGVTVGGVQLSAGQGGTPNETVSLIYNTIAFGDYIDFATLANQTLGAAPFTVSASASSGLPVVFSSLTPAVCTVSGNTVTLLALGTCTLAADQAGNAIDAAAPTVTQSFFVIAGSVPIGTRITSLPYVISAPGIYYIDQKMTTNLASGAAITISANNVVLDLNANAIGNLAAGPATQAVGILADSRQNVTVRNGVLRGFYAGVALGEFTTPGASSGNAVEKVTADQCQAVGLLVQGTGSVVRSSRVVSTNGSTALNPLTGTATNSASGIVVTGAGAQVSDDEVINTDCTNSCLLGSRALGISIVNAPGAVLSDNRILNGTLATATTSVAINFDATALNAFADNNYLAGYVSGLVFGAAGKYRDTLTNNVTVPYTGGTAIGTNN